MSSDHTPSSFRRNALIFLILALFCGVRTTFAQDVSSSCIDTNLTNCLNAAEAVYKSQCVQDLDPGVVTPDDPTPQADPNAPISTKYLSPLFHWILPSCQALSIGAVVVSWKSFHQMISCIKTEFGQGALSFCQNAVSQFCQQNAPNIVTSTCESKGLKTNINNKCVCPQDLTKVVTDISQCTSDIPIPTPAPPRPHQQPPPQNAPATGLDASTLNQQAASDRASCQSLIQTAQTCCQNPLQCMTSDQRANLQQLNALAAQNPAALSQEGLRSYCIQMQALTAGGSTANNQFASICFDRQSACQSACGNMVSQWKSRQSQCQSTSCPSQSSSIITQTISSLQGLQNTCGSVNQYSTTYSQQAVENANATAYSAYCAQQTAAAQPASVNPTTTAPTGTATSSGTDPVTGASVVGHSDPGLFINKPITGLNADGNSAAASQFDLSATEGAGTPASSNLTAATAIESQPTQATVVPNNTGGALPGESGTGNDSGFGANPSSQKAGSTASGKTANVLHGASSGAGAMQGSSIGGMNSSSDSSGFQFPRMKGQRQIGQPGLNNLSKYKGLDLKAYLPGGRLAPRDPAGFSQIRPQADDLFKAVSTRYLLNCKLGHLLGCP